MRVRKEQDDLVRHEGCLGPRLRGCREMMRNGGRKSEKLGGVMSKPWGPEAQQRKEGG